MIWEAPVVLTGQKRWKPTSFDGFLKKPSKVVENHHFSGFLKKPEKWWKTTTFDGFSKKPPKVVENHQFWAYFEKPPKIGHFCLKFGQIKLFFGWEPTIFLVSTEKMVENHRFCRIFQKSGKMGGFPGGGKIK